MNNLSRRVSGILGPFLCGVVLAAPSAPPPEIANVEATRDEIIWDSTEGTVLYKLYRSVLSALPTLCTVGVSVHAETTAAAPELPQPGEGVAYLVSAVNSVGEGPLEPNGSTLRAQALVCDTDGDGVVDAADNCPHDGNPLQLDDDLDGVGNSCDFPSSGVTAVGRVPLSAFPGNTEAGRVESYVSPSGAEYAIVGLESGTAFVRVTDPANPGIVGFVDGDGADDRDRDIAVFGEHAYLIGEATVAGPGLQIVDLAQIDDDIVALAGNSDLGIGATEALGLFVNVDSGFLYVGTPDRPIRPGGLGFHVLDLNTDPTEPTLAGTWIDTEDGGVFCYDLHVRSYVGGPLDGREIVYCFATQNGVRIVDATDKASLGRLSEFFYPDTDSTHHGWLSDNGRYLFVGDNRDEVPSSTTTTHVVDVSMPTSPSLVDSFTNGLPALDYDLTIRDDFAFEANSTSGLRVWDVCDPESSSEIGFFDTFPLNDTVNFFVEGALGVDTRLPSGTVLVSDTHRGLLLLDPTGALATASRDRCTTGPPLDLPCDSCVEAICAQDLLCCFAAWDSSCVAKVRTVCGSLTCEESAGSCAHTLCSSGASLSPGCDVPPASTSCVDAVCATMPTCCDTVWDEACVEAVSSVCGANCD